MKGGERGGRKYKIIILLKKRLFWLTCSIHATKEREREGGRERKRERVCVCVCACVCRCVTELSRGVPARVSTWR